jgi:thiamine pyrophosphokinase
VSELEGICIIVGAGEFSENIIKKDNNDLIIAADGGLKKLEEIGIIPDIVIGDFDSLGYDPKSDVKIKLPKEKDVTDTAAAVEYGIKKGYRRFRIFGGTGGRNDHTVANIQLLIGLIRRGYKAELVDETQIYTALHNGNMKFNENMKGYISVFSYSDVSMGVSEKGLKYSLKDAVLENTTPLGVSNEFLGFKAEISVESGTLLIIYDRQ